jgi:hypothetical protein
MFHGWEGTVPFLGRAKPGRLLFARPTSAECDHEGETMMAGKIKSTQIATACSEALASYEGKGRAISELRPPGRAPAYCSQRVKLSSRR